MYKGRLSDLSSYVSEKISAAHLTDQTYIGVDNMLPNCCGVKPSEYVPETGLATKFEQGDILLGNIRPYFKKIWLAEFDGGCSPDVLVIRPEHGVSSKFLYAYLSTDSFFDYDMKGAKGSKMPRGDKDHIMRYEIIIPDEQEKIGSFIIDINKKITNNNAIAAELEGMAKDLYDYWFVQFDFPDENGKPYKSSGGKMVWNEELKREIPEGWKKSLLNNIAQIVTDTVSPAASPKRIFEHYSIPAFDNGKYPSFECGSKIESNKYKVPKASILVSKLNPQFKRVWKPLELTANCICSTEFMPFIAKPGYPLEFIYMLLNSTAFQRYLILCSSSSTGSRKRMQPDLCDSFSFACPEKHEVIDNFSRVIAPMIAAISSIAEENVELASLRDFLLPMLMNGQVKVKGA